MKLVANMLSGTGGKKLGPPRLRIQQAGGGEHRVAGHFGVDAKPRAAGQQPILRIALQQLVGKSRVLAIGRRGDDRSQQVLQAPIVLHEVDGQPIEQLGVRRRRGANAEVLGRFHDPDAEHRLPDAIDRDSSRRRRTPIDEPARERQPIGLGVLRQRMQRRGHAGRYRDGRLLPVAAIQDRGLAMMFRRPRREIQHRFAFRIVGPELVDRGVRLRRSLDLFRARR